MSDFASQFIPTGDEGAATPKASGFADQFIPGSKTVAPQRDDVGALQHGVSGVNEGIAQFLGLPVDVAEMVINLGIEGANAALGTDIRPLQGSFGGSRTTQAAMSPFVTDAKPDSAGERYSRRVGQEVGFGAPAALTTAGVGGQTVRAASANMPKFMVANTVADVAAGTAGQTAREILPESDLADFLATMIGGGSTAAVTGSGIKTGGTTPPTTDELFKKASEAGERVRSSHVRLTPEAQARFYATLDEALVNARASKVRHPRAYDVVSDAKSRPAPELIDVDDARYVFGRDVASNKDEAAIGMALKEATEKFLNGLTAKDVTGGDVAGAVEDLTKKRKLAHAGYKAQSIEGKEYRAKSRAASTGTGGNQINAMKQNVRGILDNEVAPTRAGKKSGYTDAEIAQMEKIVFGDRPRNALRWMSRFSPTSGMLSGSLGAAGTGAALLGGPANPLAYAAAAPATLGYIAKHVGENVTSKDIDNLLAIIRNLGVEPATPVNALAPALSVEALRAGNHLGPHQ